MITVRAMTRKDVSEVHITYDCVKGLSEPKYVLKTDAKKTEKNQPLPLRKKWCLNKNGCSPKRKTAVFHLLPIRSLTTAN